MAHRFTTALLLALVFAHCSPALAARPGDGDRAPTLANPHARLQLRHFMRGLAEAAKAQVIAGKLASVRGSTPEVRAFGKQLSRDRQLLGRRLSLLSLHNQVPLPSRPAKADHTLISRLRSLHGREFDLAFLQQFGVAVQEREVALYRSGLPDVSDPGLRKFAQLSEPSVQAQLVIARELLAQARTPAPVPAAADAAAAQGSAAPGQRSPPSAGETWDAEERDAMQGVIRAAEVLRKMKEDPRMDSLLGKARAVLVFTQYRRGGLIVGVRTGQGVLVTRHGDGFSPPAFYRLRGGSIGLQAGAASGATVYLLMSELAVQRFRSRGEFSADAFVAGTLGTKAQRWQSSAGKVEDLVAWSGTHGAYGGAAVGGTRIVADEAANRAYYGRAVSASEILGGLVQNPHENILAGLIGP